MNKPYIGYIIATLVCLHGFISGWAVSGMETVFFTMLVSLFVYCVVNDKRFFAGLLILVVVFTRHDGLLLLPVYLWMIKGCWKYRVEGLYILAIIGIYYLARYFYYGDIIPHVMQVKSANPYYSANPHEMLQYWMLYGATILFGLIATFKKSPLGIYCIISLIVYAFGIRADLVRYSVHLLPVMVLLVLSNSQQHRKQFIYAFIIILSLNTYLSLNKFRPFVKGYYQTQNLRMLIGHTVKTKIPESERIISGDIGMIAYTAINHKFIDLVGLTTAVPYEVALRQEQGTTLPPKLDRNPLKAKYIADTITTDGKYPRLPGNHEILLEYGQRGKPYKIGLLKRETQ